MITKTQISRRTLKKRNPEIVETIKLAKSNNLLELAKRLSGSSSIYKNMNLDEIEKIDSNKIMIVGKVLGSGDINRKIEIYALGFSKQATDKLNKADCKIGKIKDEINRNKNLNGVKILW